MGIPFVIQWESSFTYLIQNRYNYYEVNICCSFGNICECWNLVPFSLILIDMKLINYYVVEEIRRQVKLTDLFTLLLSGHHPHDMREKYAWGIVVPLPYSKNGYVSVVRVTVSFVLLRRHYTDLSLTQTRSRRCVVICQSCSARGGT